MFGSALVSQLEAGSPCTPKSSGDHQKLLQLLVDAPGVVLPPAEDRCMQWQVPTGGHHAATGVQAL